jgi:agmatinase
MDEVIESLARFWAPQGIYTVSTGQGLMAEALLRQYGSLEHLTIDALWRARLATLPEAKGWMLGVPFDTGAGFERGSFQGPMFLRQALGDPCDLPPGWVDVGDVRVHPQLVHDSLHNEAVLQAVRAARRMPPLEPAPVSALSILEHTLDLAWSVRPDLHVVLLGGDHSISRAGAGAWLKRQGGAPDVGVLHFDAHTDLLETREGVAWSFATWAWHVRARLPRPDHLLQVGIRASGHPRDHWVSTLGVAQWWASDVLANPDAVVREVTSHVESRGIRRLYVSLDIDVLDPRHASATGTRAPDGLAPGDVLRILESVGRVARIEVADLVEVAPPLRGTGVDEPGRTLRAATACLRAILAGMG